MAELKTQRNDASVEDFLNSVEHDKRRTDGFAVLEDLKREPDTRNIPVIVITAKDLSEEEQQQLEGQVEVLLRKGLFTEQELLDDLGTALSRIEQ